MSVLDVCNANMDDDELFLDNATDARSEATTPAAPSKRARKASSGSMPSTPLSIGGGGGDMATCLIPECEEFLKPKSRWCPLHDRYAANLTYSAGKYEEEGHPNFKEEYTKKMRSDEFAISEVREEEQRNPPSLNLLKKQKQKPNWASKQEIWEKRTDTVDKKRAVPYEKKQFLIKREKKFGRTPEEALQEWPAFEKTCEDDN